METNDIFARAFDREANGDLIPPPGTAKGPHSGVCLKIQKDITKRIEERRGMEEAPEWSILRTHLMEMGAQTLLLSQLQIETDNRVSDLEKRLDGANGALASIITLMLPLLKALNDDPEIITMIKDIEALIALNESLEEA